MSKQKLSTVLNQVIHRLENSKKEIREAIADKRGQRLRVTNTELRFQIESFAADKGFSISSQQSNEISRAITDFCNSVFNSFKTKKGYQSSIVGSPTDFSIEVVATQATGSVFKLALRQQLNPYLEKLERSVANILQGDEKLFVRGIENESGKSKTKGFLNLGHTHQSSIAVMGPSLAMTAGEKSVVTKNYFEDLNFALTKYGFFDNPGTFMELELERSSANFATSTKEERNRLKTISKELKNILERIDIANVQGSPSLVQEAREAIEDGLQNKRRKRRQPSKATKKRKVKTVVRDSRLNLNLTGQQKNPGNWLSLISMINARLPQAVRANMGAPGLVNRTGAFSESTRVTGVQITPQGFPSFSYTYDKTPYGVFDPRTGALPWATPARDPNKLIEKSIRDIAASMAIGRFYLRRQ